jgi:hypothetical protein
MRSFSLSLKNKSIGAQTSSPWLVLFLEGLQGSHSWCFHCIYFINIKVNPRFTGCNCTYATRGSKCAITWITARFGCDPN